ncbi:MAG: GNAT family N-acetyltransferase [Chloroflexi bacterium]|nr:GNAT family N-acetyltransferase [Chloroflexota bacterium]
MCDTPFFSSEAFLGAVARCHFPGQPWALETVEVEGLPFRVLTVRGRVIDAQWTHPFSYEPLPPGTPCSRQHRFLAKVVHGVVPAPEETLKWPLYPAPFVDWRGVASFEAYQQSRRSGPYPATWATVARGGRGLARDVGEVEFVLDDAGPDVLPALFNWKSRQYRRSGYPDPFAPAASRKFYEALRDEGVLLVSTVRAGGRVVAGHAGYRWNRRFYARLVAHDPDLGRYSPGTVLLHHLLRESFESGDEQFDFLGGAERYKWSYATHARVLGPLGVQTAAQRLEERVRTTVGTTLLRLRQGRLSALGSSDG